jgi:hypothetical protein
MPKCPGPNCPTGTEGQPPAGQDTRTTYVVDISQLLQAKDQTSLARSYGLFALARQAYSHARLIEVDDRKLGRRLDDLVSIATEEAITEGFKAAPQAAKAAGY